ncbi:ATPase family AAA domain-containing protein 5-like [Argopecten irradians]|uniref:ATPase family AAA domain-containing protein 5-like n=1 Tax=Argopecten irradians TaxID=31199 RepID=UPI00372484C1
MLGVTMEEGVSEKENEQISNELQSPQRSILDFFKSPDKSKAIKKPTNLLSYFGTAQQKEAEQKQHKKKLNGTEKQNGNLVKKGEKGPGKKRKQVDRDAERNDGDDFEEEQKGKGKKRKKCEEEVSVKTEGTNNTEKGGMKNSNLVNGNIDHRADTDESNKQKTKERKSKEKKKISKIVDDNGVGCDQEISTPDKKCGKNLQKSADAKKAVLEQKGKHKQTVTTKISEESEKTEEEKEGKGDNDENETVSEMCYEDFIKSLGNNEVSKTDDNEESEAVVLEKTNKKDENEDETTESKEDLYIKNYPTISNFFQKVDKAAAPTAPTDPKILGQVTIKVDIHSEPSPNNNTSSNHVSTKTPSVLSKKDEEVIEIISSETITIDCTPSSKKSLFGVKKDSSDDIEFVKLENKIGSSVESLSSCEDSCMSEDSSVCVVEEVEDASKLERKKCFLQSATVPEIPAKTTQVTLGFSKAGLQVQKPMKPTHSTRIRKKDSVDVDNPPVFDRTPNKKQSRKAKKTFDLGVDKETPDKAGTPRRKSTKEKGKKTAVTEDVENVSDRRSSLRSRYRVAIIGAGSGKKTPIRMKFNRYSKSSSSGVEDGENFTPRSSKQAKKNTKLSKAKELLQKAKQKNSKTKTVNKIKRSSKKSMPEEEESADEAKPASRRRSSRLSDKVSKESIVLVDSDDEVDGCVVPTPKAKGRTKSTSAKATPNKGTPSKGRKTPSKKAGKLASIFLSGKAAKEEKKPVVVLDPEAEKLKRAFLMSGVPDELRRQAITNDVIIIEDYPPLPTVNHTQQKESEMTNRHGVKVWDLSSVTVPKLGNLDMESLSEKSMEWWKGLVGTDSSPPDCSRIREFQKHVRIEDGDVEKILAEISSCCPTYPINKVFSVLKMKRDDFEQEAKEAEQVDRKTETQTAEEKKNEKAAPRRSLRKRVSLELPQVVELGGNSSLQTAEDAPSSEVNKQDTVPTVNWTDKYLPLHSTEVVGNTAKVRKLHSWLVEWKQRLDKEARKAKKLELKKNKGKQNKDSGNRDDWWDDDSDFALDSDDSDDDEDDRLCNTAMLYGPSGIGKTATVYGLAHELGFKVFEVNASSTRNGKRILSQLQEATQSHQVSRGTDTPTKCPPSKLVSSTQPSAKVPSAFSSFFKQTSNSSNKTGNVGKESKSKKDKESAKQKKRKRDSEAMDIDEKTPKKSKTKEKPESAAPIDPKADGSLNLSSTSLILFEEIDLVFPTDHGFWAAVQQFMATTKIPIILTTSDSGVVNKFEGRFDQYRFKTPPYRNIAVYLQLMCLAENVRTDFFDMYNLVSLCCGDIRRCILSLQYWVISGGGVKGIRRSIHRTVKQTPQTDKSAEENVANTKNNSLHKQVSSIGDEDDDDFVCLKPVCQKRRFISDDEESNSMPPVPLRYNQDLVNEGSKDMDMEKDRLPLVHLGHATSLEGLTLKDHGNILSLLKLMVQVDDDSLVTLARRVCDQYHTLKCDLLYRHHLSLLPLNRVESLPLKPSQPVVQKKSHRRIKTFDLYDSETSNDGLDNLPNQPMECEESQSETPAKTLDPKESALVGKSLKSFYSFYDSLSLTDSMAALEERLAGSGERSGSKFDFHSDIQLYSCRRMYKAHEEMKSDITASEHICVPITEDTPRPEELQGKDHINKSVDTPTSRASSNVRTCLPLGIPAGGIHQEYLPTLRTICKSEQLREQAKIKRRFQHYLDSIGLQLKDNTLSVLCTTFRS